MEVFNSAETSTQNVKRWKKSKPRVTCCLLAVVVIMSSFSDFTTHTSKLFYDYHRLPEFAPSHRFYSSIQSHRSRVFARRDERFPALENGNRTTKGFQQAKNTTGRLSEPLKQSKSKCTLYVRDTPFLLKYYLWRLAQMSSYLLLFGCCNCFAAMVFLFILETIL